jgi:mitochondrial distribution and morphology protein 10
LSIGIGKEISKVLKSAYLIGIESHSIAYAYSSVHRTIKHNRANQLLYGRIFQDGRIEGIVSRQMNPNILFSISSVNSWNVTQENLSNFQMNWVKISDKYCGEISYTSDNHIFGLSGLSRIANWSFGGEVYYTAKEKSGGLSFGAKMDTIVNDEVSGSTTLIANPIMGHFSTSYAAKVSPLVRMATKYDFNMYSYDCDLSYGIEFTPLDKKQTLKASVSQLKVFLFY